MYIKQYEGVASYDESKPDIYWKLEILDGNWMVGCGNWIGRPSPLVSLFPHLKWDFIISWHFRIKNEYIQSV
jgi:hypothetical protein